MDQNFHLVEVYKEIGVLKNKINMNSIYTFSSYHAGNHSLSYKNQCECSMGKYCCSEIHTKHINTLCGHNTEFLHVKPGDTVTTKVRRGNDCDSC